MRKNKLATQDQISLLTVDDDLNITCTIKSIFERSGRYTVDIENNPEKAIERIRNGSYDILLLDYLMPTMCGDKVVEEIRKFNSELFIIFLTGHKDMVPPVQTIRQLDIQGYYEKGPRFDELELLVESCVKSIKQLRMIRKYQEEVMNAYMQTIETLRNVVETRDHETRGHSERVSILAASIAKEMGMSDNEIERIRIAGLFHDIGKIGVPDAILLKDGPLSQIEYEEIKRHPAEGEKILSTCSSFEDILPIIRHHHERVDGRGYPDGLTGDQICLGAKITAVADAFDAMVSNRTYRKGLGFDIAMDRIAQGTNSQFDEQAVAGLHKLIDSLGREEFEKKFCSQVNTLE